MTLWVIEPRDPLIFRDGKPFSANPGARATSLSFPYPSTIAGGIRTRAGTDNATGRFDKSRINDLLEKQIRGPLLVEVDQAGKIAEYLMPAPADVLLLRTGEENKVLRKWLRPLNLPKNVTTNLDSLQVVGPASIVKGKPHLKPPPFWHYKAYAQWLEAPSEGIIQRDTLGHDGPERESRTHVSIDPAKQTAREGALFQTSGLEFTRAKRDNSLTRLSTTRTLALAVDTDADLPEGLDFLGGERRVVHWRRVEDALPACPKQVRQTILDQRACRLILLTPGYFEAGYLPTWVLGAVHNMRVIVQGAAVRRYQTVSGWDYDNGCPKPIRRLAPAGSVYFLKFEGDKAAIDRFIDAVWMQTISDDEQSRRDSFGLAVVGTWDGELQNMEVNP